MKLLNKLLRPLIKDLIAEEINNLIHTNPPKLKKLKLHQLRKKHDKLDVWDAFKMDVVSISLCVRYFDDNGLEEFSSSRVNDIPELKHLLKKFTPKYEKFESVSIHVKIKNSKEAIITNIVTADKGYYTSKDLPLVFEPIYEWFDENSEYLI